MAHFLPRNKNGLKDFGSFEGDHPHGFLSAQNPNLI